MPVTSDYIAVDENVWHDVYVRLDGTNVALYAGTRDGGMKLLTKCTTIVAASTNRIEVRVKGSLDRALGIALSGDAAHAGAWA